ncbi:NAD(P)-dependent oxidoreductase [uncultured Mitsuokella sp.]|uniref:NAD-dependent epimerase/dehydratase family protein n=1 Tax=uncultured Mitsuokella sp. TaxID=453120 RepID=UPI002626C6D5|nr:NAD-dependent epimerase/dehydratase family protein [uncultured Mitsuokella sp.]
MDIHEHPLYKEDVKRVAELSLPWEKIQDASILISGATGLIGSFLIDVLMWRNTYRKANCKVFALGRSEEKAKRRFAYYKDSSLFHFLSHDINEPLHLQNNERIEYVLHLASNTHPVAYATDPIGTITTNIIGLKNMLDFGVYHHTKRFAFASSNEIYGENRGDQELFDEHYCGYIDCNTLRAGYPESKRCGEALCQAYMKQKGLDVVIPRLTRSYGPTMLESDTKAISQFIKKAIASEDIVLKSAGNQYYSYTYVADAVSGLLTVLLLGKSGEAYNIADQHSDITLKDLAATLAKIAGTKVIFEIPDATEKAGYSKATKARLDGKKMHRLGWMPFYNIKTGIQVTIQVLIELK